MTRYLHSLTKEAELVARYVRGLRTISHIHFGGGTPTMMSAVQMRSLMGVLRSRFTFEGDAEVAIEVDPRTLSEDMAQTLGKCGLNRASLGVQSFDGRVQRAINRVQSFEQVREAMRLLRANGIRHINFDLVYGLPNQTLQSCLETVAQAAALRPDRLAVFGYAHVPAFKPHQRKIDETSLPDSDARFTGSRAMARTLVNAGYVEIGLDHFALPSDPLTRAAKNGRLHRNFQGYTTDGAEILIGLGASSISRMPQGYVQNHVGIPEYQRLLAAGKLPIARGYRFAGEDRLRASLIERLMCDNKVDVVDICQPFGVDPAPLLAAAPLDSFLADGLIEIEEGMLTVRPHARPLVRTIAAAFDEHLRRDDRCSRAV